MSLIETFQMAVQNILSSKMRTFLTMLGIIILSLIHISEPTRPY